MRGEALFHFVSLLNVWVNRRQLDSLSSWHSICCDISHDLGSEKLHWTLRKECKQGKWCFSIIMKIVSMSGTPLKDSQGSPHYMNSHNNSVIEEKWRNWGLGREGTCPGSHGGDNSTGICSQVAGCEVGALPPHVTSQQFLQYLTVIWFLHSSIADVDRILFP